MLLDHCVEIVVQFEEQGWEFVQFVPFGAIHMKPSILAVKKSEVIAMPAFVVVARKERVEGVEPDFAELKIREEYRVNSRNI
jgi:hypothetical protein